ncbi:Acetylornithine deacetylase/Succinyl-diaminopimelate desuccinylase [Granulicella pectinivorans]|jgi:acetylornithine deacetylase/succinyl-diaminopimelate desuccinylase-like protein|uniref:Acetylornithine deacetylase/Succinyl-diaminopimelate desuccinylase n=1 Tax=Granulicella pectinivorans TaxID=474950 RepID=A0A1I6MNB8_9BACT|nr:M20/M25/M40 family metallo-hydrolase [Granulicella pectinivorans]SFS17144.1 Acetylornithine deacetylase/Succinyl-diaminopimelate desuccinylase [Granulicella pectinivorans]
MATAAHYQFRITRLVSTLPVHRAFHWLHLHQPQMRMWLLELLAIPAPPFGEAARAQWFVERFTAIGLTNVHLDDAGNALGELGPGDGPVTLLSAHLDTVFPAGTLTVPTEEGSVIRGPGACDNGPGLTALLGIAAALRYANITPPTTILFAANVGEEGEGNLRGMRHLFSTGPYTGRIRTAIALEGSGTGAVVTSGLGSLRFRLTASGPGGHSWTDAGTPNPILHLARALTALSSVPLPDAPRTTLNVGRIEGGTSINSIPESASALLDLRSTDPTQLRTTETHLRAVLAPHPVVVELIGDRPAATLPNDVPLLQVLRAVDRHLGLRTEPRIGSTDANIPLSLGIPAIAIGTGGTGGGIHTLAEWYDPTGRELALRRVLLTLLDSLPDSE